MLSILTLLLTVAALFVLLSCVRNLQLHGKSRKLVMLAAGSLVVAVVSGIALVKPLLFPAADSLSGNDQDRLFAAHAYMVTKAIAPERRTGEIVFLVRDTELGTPRTELLLAAARENLGSNANIKVIPIEPELRKRYPADELPPFQSLVRAADFDRALRGCEKSAVVVFAAELPRDNGAMRYWSWRNRPETYVLNAPTALDRAVQNRQIAGYTILNAEADFSNRAIPGDYAAAFASRYRMVPSVN